MAKEDRSPEAIMRRAQLWGEVFRAKDQGQVLRVVVQERVRKGYLVALPWDDIKAFLPSQEELPEGLELEARITAANYVTKEIRVKRVIPKEAIQEIMEELREAQRRGETVRVRLRSVVQNGALVEYKGIKAFVPQSKLGMSEEEARARIGEEFLARFIKVSKRGSVAALVLEETRD